MIQTRINLPRRMLGIVRDTLEFDLKIEAIMPPENPPTIVTEIGSIVYFASTGDFKIFLEDGHRIFKTPNALVAYMQMKYDTPEEVEG